MVARGSVGDAAVAVWEEAEFFEVGAGGGALDDEPVWGCACFADVEAGVLRVGPACEEEDVAIVGVEDIAWGEEVP